MRRETTPRVDKRVDPHGKAGKGDHPLSWSKTDRRNRARFKEERREKREEGGIFARMTEEFGRSACACRRC